MRIPLLVLLLLGLTSAGALYWFYWYYIVEHPGKEFSRQAILQSLSIETPAYYDDGQNLIGVFFENEHRMYVRYQDIPPDLVRALIAAEDKNFFHHSGIDVLSVLRATVANLRAGRVVQGGSTLSQQTAKNLFKRRGRTFDAKFKELVQTLKLEAHHSKQDIVEYFVNQFYVSGTGRGLGIAAKYFFDKPASELNLLECAFIAGSVRAPNWYDPLIQSDPEKRRATLERAVRRKNYVLRNMLKLKMISAETYEELVHAPIRFKKGKIYYRLNVIMDYIRDQLQTEKFQEVLAKEGISNIATSGIRIYTTVNQEIQEASLHSLRKHLSQVETLLSGYRREDVQSRYAGLEKTSARQPKMGSFLFGRVEKKNISGEHSNLAVRIGGMLCTVDYTGLMNLAVPYAKANKGSWAKASVTDVQDLLRQIEPGDLVYVHVRENRVDGEHEEFFLDLEQKPRLEGGIIVMHKGKIISMVGGSENIYFNRAVTAQRQLGSIFKPLVYTAAVQLGWNIVDPLQNQRDVFGFQNQFYFPRPDHVSRHEQVSLAWAGVKSENVASVWLLYHLCDHLSPAQFTKIAQLVGLTPREGEGYAAFRQRMRDGWGIIITDDTLKEVAYGAAQEEIITDLIFEGRTEEAEAVKHLKYGSGFDEHRALLAQEWQKASQRDERSAKEFELKISILQKHFLRYLRLNAQMLEDWTYLKNAFFYSYPDAGTILNIISRFYTGVRDGRRVVAYGERLASEGFTPLTYAQAHALFSGSEELGMAAAPQPGDVWVEGELSSSVLATLTTTLNRELARLQRKSPYQMETLYKVRDYRVLTGLLYVVKLCQTMGIETPLDPVLSFPLGPHAVNLLEMSRAYATLLEGCCYGDEQNPSSDGALIIDGIKDAEEQELYRLAPQNRQILSRYSTSMINEIMKNVVEHGTGKKACNAVTMEVDLGTGGEPLKVSIPTLGKTGTANEYSNSSYIGVVPGLMEGKPELTLENGFVIAVYVGYDDNAPMKNGGVRIYGAAGALPIWIDVANAIVRSKLYQRMLDPVDFAFLPQNTLPLSPITDTIMLPVSKENGCALPREQYHEDEHPAILYSYGESDGRSFHPKRYFIPLTEHDIMERMTAESSLILKGER